MEENHLKVVTMTCVASQLPASGLGRMETGILHFTFHINVEPKVGADDTPHINMFNEYLDEERVLILDGKYFCIINEIFFQVGW